MFNRDFYPTPDDVIEKMLITVDVRNKIVLEPSAGKGNIIDYLKSMEAKEILCCEKNADLAKIAASKADVFLKSDFLQVTAEEISHIDLIIMNPPFSNEERHILHAWDIAPEGATVISLCNSSIINSYRANRQINSLIEHYGTSENLGDCFSSAERKTNVNVSCIWLYKPKGDNEFEDFFFMGEDEQYSQEGILKYNYIQDIVSRYTGALKLFDKVQEMSEEINGITDPISKYSIKFGAFKPGERTNIAITKAKFAKDLQRQCWKKVFKDMNMDKYLTTQVKKQLNYFVEKYTHVPFTMKNIYRMAEMIVGTHADRVTRIIIEAFDQICNFSWRDNCTGGDNWKTNSDYMVNKKFIIPYITEHNSYGTLREHLYLSYNGENKIKDILIALCYLSGKNYDMIADFRSFINNSKLEWSKWYIYEPFFRIRGYKKGTMHFEFLYEDLWIKFNIEAAKAKGWNLPYKTNSSKKQNKRGSGLINTPNF